MYKYIFREAYLLKSHIHRNYKGMIAGFVLLLISLGLFAYGRLLDYVDTLSDIMHLIPAVTLMVISSSLLAVGIIGAIQVVFRVFGLPTIIRYEIMGVSLLLTTILFFMFELGFSNFIWFFTFLFLHSLLTKLIYGETRTTQRSSDGRWIKTKVGTNLPVEDVFYAFMPNPDHLEKYHNERFISADWANQEKTKIIARFKSEDKISVLEEIYEMFSEDVFSSIQYTWSVAGDHAEEFRGKSHYRFMQNGNRTKVIYKFKMDKTPYKLLVSSFFRDDVGASLDETILKVKMKKRFG